MRLGLAAALILVGGVISADAQWLDRKTPGIPRTPDGKPNLTAPAPRGPAGKPDLSGVWEAENVVGRPDPATLQPWVLELSRQRQLEYYKGRPMYQCRPSGPEAERFGGWKRIVQTPAAVAILNDDLTHRIIHTDGRELEANPAPSWMGYSAGRWDGDTLVVESNGFNDKTWVSRYGVSHTESLTMTERYRRRDVGHMQLEVTFTDPGAFIKPWGFTVEMTLAADTEMLEAVCEKSSDTWAGSLSDAANQGVKVPSEVLARYVGVYRGIYGGSERTYEVTVTNGELFAKILGPRIEGGLGATGLDDSVPRPLVPQSHTVFEGLGLGYQFEVDEKGGPATALIVIHISGPYRYSRLK
jgi:hypothetical protein